MTLNIDGYTTQELIPLIEEWKKMSGMEIWTIYCLHNSCNNKIYIGQTVKSISKRMGSEGCGYRNCRHLYKALTKYGCENFYYEILVIAFSLEEANELEQYFIEKYDAANIDIGYNLKLGGANGKCSQETKDKISATLKDGKAYWTGKHHSEETIKKLSDAMTGRTLTPEHREKVIQTLRPAMFTGHHHTEEVKAILSETSKMSEEREQEIMRLYAAGNGINKIEDLTGSSTQTIASVLKRNNIEIVPSKKPSKETIEKTKQSQELAKELYSDKEERAKKVLETYLAGKTMKEISKEFIINYRDIYNIIDDNNIVRRNASAKDIERVKINKDPEARAFRDAQVVQAYTSGQLVSEICTQFNIKSRELNKIIDAVNIPRRPRRN
jgi:group I intron endonuclease